MVQWSSRSLARDKLSPEGFIEPCQPVLSGVVPVGPDWVYELKHDGWRILARKNGDRVRLKRGFPTSREERTMKPLPQMK
jgi:ATP-dependent DNA ligase